MKENAIKGGIRAVTRDEFGRPRRTKSRAVTGIDQDIKLNKALWLLGARMAELKGARCRAQKSQRQVRLDTGGRLTDE